MKTILPVLFFISILFGTEQPRTSRPSSVKKESLQEWKIFDVNNIWCTINSSGPYADYLRTNASGMYWPKGTTKNSVYTAGLWIIGKHRPTSVLRTAVMDYMTEFQPGPILSRYNTTTNSVAAAADPSDARYRLYKIDRRSTMLENDYREWPGDLGAPYVDKNGNGRWDAGTDTPRLLGDQTLWSVYNDGNPAAHVKAGMTSPMGIEVRATYFGFGEYPPLSNVMFMKFSIINKSDADYDSVYASLWSDMDLGDANDDLAGYDSTVRLSYVYNGDNSDDGASGYGIKPPAGGFTLIQGPLVAGAPDDTGVRDGIAISGRKNLPPASHVVYFGGGGGVGWNDPALGSTSFAATAYRYQRGFVGSTGYPFVNPTTSQVTPFVFDGDPVSGTGWIQTMTAGAQDVRSMISVGPFTLAQDDTQEIIAAYVIAQGKDRLESVTRLRESTAFARTVAKAGFTFPPVKATPVHSTDSVTITMEADVKAYNASALSVTVTRRSNDSVLSVRALNDNGTDGDITPQDNIFTGTFRFSHSREPIRIDGVLQLPGGISMHWPSLADRLPLSLLKPEKPVLVSDARNMDGTVQPGETFRYTVSLRNDHPFGFSDITVQNSVDYNPRIVFDKLDPATTATVPYSPDNFYRYLSRTVPADYSGTLLTEYLTITDGAGNVWSDSVTIPIVRRTEYTTKAQKVAGRSPAAIEVVVQNRSQVKDHLYAVTGVDSSGRILGLEVRDSTEGRRIGDIIRISSNSAVSDMNHRIPLTDGFKVNISSLQWYSLATGTLRSKDSTSWFTTNIYPTRSMYWVPPRSTANPGDIPAIRIAFSPIDSVMPPQSSGTMVSNNRTYWYPLGSNTRRQKVYLYSSKAFLGFVEVPFVVYNISGNAPQQCDVVLYRSSSSVAPMWIHGVDRLYIMETPYSAEGMNYDSAKGGVNLLPNFEFGVDFPYHYVLTMSRSDRPINDTIDLFIDCVPAFSSRDIFTFRPSELQLNTGVVPTTAVLWPNYPNPFNPATTIRYALPNRSPASLTIYNVLGQQVRLLVNETRGAGTYEIDWDGRDDRGILLSSGIYFYRITTEGSTITKKMLMVK